MHKIYFDRGTKIHAIKFDGTEQSFLRLCGFLKEFSLELLTDSNAVPVAVKIYNAEGKLALELAKGDAVYIQVRNGVNKIIATEYNELIEAVAQVALTKVEKTPFHWSFHRPKEFVGGPQHAAYAVFCSESAFYKDVTIKDKQKIKTWTAELPDGGKLTCTNGEFKLEYGPECEKVELTAKPDDYLIWVPAAKRYFNCSAEFLAEVFSLALPRMHADLHTADHDWFRWPGFTEVATDEPGMLQFELVPYSGITYQIPAPLVNKYFTRFFSTLRMQLKGTWMSVCNLSWDWHWQKLAKMLKAELVVLESEDGKGQEFILTMPNGIKVRSKSVRCVMLYTDEFIIPLPLKLASRLVYANYREIEEDQTVEFHKKLDGKEPKAKMKKAEVEPK